MIDASTVVWLEDRGGAESAAPSVPSEDARRALASWGKARGVTLVAPGEASGASMAVDVAAVDRVERALAKAHDALVALDLDGAERALGEAGVVVRAHPELPQAAWLRAEVERAWAARWLRDPRGGREASEHAEDAGRRASALDGGRAAGIGERDAAAPAAVTVRLVIDGDARGSVVWIDGETVAPGVVTRAAGEHDVVVTREDGAVTWAAWVPFGDGDVIHAVAAPAPACSRDDASHARIEAGVVDARGVACAHWVAAVAGSDGSIRVATCEGASCGPLVEWRTGLGVGSELPVEPHPSAEHGLPTWATWALAGAALGGAVLTAALVSNATKPAPTETRFVDGGLQIRSF